jgi:hypothetical protein
VATIQIPSRDELASQPPAPPPQRADGDDDVRAFYRAQDEAAEDSRAYFRARKRRRRG